MTFIHRKLAPFIEIVLCYEEDREMQLKALEKASKWTLRNLKNMLFDSTTKQKDMSRVLEKKKSELEVHLFLQTFNCIPWSLSINGVLMSFCGGSSVVLKWPMYGTLVRTSDHSFIFRPHDDNFICWWRSWDVGESTRNSGKRSLSTFSDFQQMKFILNHFPDCFLDGCIQMAF